MRKSLAKSAGPWLPGMIAGFHMTSLEFAENYYLYKFSTPNGFLFFAWRGSYMTAERGVKLI